MILNVSDIHFGCRQHSSQLSSGYVTTEEICINILNQIVAAAKDDSVKLITMSGDICHTNHPTTLVSDYLIKFFTELNSIGKPIVIIPGNHDRSNYAYSFIFLRQLNLNNLVIFDDVSGDCYYKQDIYKDIDMYFIPFAISSDLTNKYSSVKDRIAEICRGATRRTLIFSHLKEGASQLGSESSLISKSAEDIDLNEINTGTKDIMFVLGHMHMFQTYTKQNGFKVIYPGCPYPMDKTDCNQKKGYIVVDPYTFDFEFKALKQLRNFSKVQVPEGVSILDFFKSTRILKNTFYFIDKYISSDMDYEDELEVNRFLAKASAKCESIKYIRQDIKRIIDSTVNITSVNTDSLVELFKAKADKEKSIFAPEHHKMFIDGGIEIINNAATAFNQKKGCETI